MEWYHPGEIVIVAHVRRGTLDTGRVHDALRSRLGNEIPADPATLRSFRFDAPNQDMSLVFLIQKLTTNDSVKKVKDVVETLHGQLDPLSTADMEVLTAMPHWHVKAHDPYYGGSPGSDPVPVRKVDGAHREYVPRADALKPQPAANGKAIHVAVLDTHWNLQAAQRRGESLKNAQLVDTINALSGSMQNLNAFDEEWKEVGQYHRGNTSPDVYHMPDHGLFISGLIHSMAPHAQLSYQPVLDDVGVGDLSLLLLGLERVLETKPENALQIINLSLGFMPHPARLPAAWYGLPRPNDPMYERPEELFNETQDRRWVATNRHHVNETVGLLEKGLHELARYLRLNNCLVVAAAGNDSVGQRRMDARLPARFESVLGVAATTGDPDKPAPYSNLGDETELGDHVATFGGSITSHDQPEDGVIGIYAGDFPSGKPNETGWAYWSGTSFATGLVSGMAANVWARSPELEAGAVLDEVHAAAQSGGHYVPELRAPAIAVEGRWR